MGKMNIIYSLLYIFIIANTIWISTALLDIKDQFNGLIRHRRSDASGKIYFEAGRKLSLPCFNTEDESREFYWIFKSSNLEKYYAADIKDATKLKNGEKYGDIILDQPMEDTLSCFITDGDVKMKEYKLIKSVSPSPEISIKKGIITMNDSVSVGNYIVECKAANGVPKPTITLKIATEKFMEKNVNLISVNFDLTRDMNGQQIRCKVDQLLYNKNISIPEISKMLNITFPPYFIDTKRDTTAVTGKEVILTFFYHANPQHSNFQWTYSYDCNGDDRLSDFEAHYKISNPKLVDDTKDKYSADLTLSPVAEEDLNRCFYLTVTNSEGSDSFQQTLHSDASEDLSPGVIVGIVFGALAGVLFVTGAGLLTWRKLKG